VPTGVGSGQLSQMISHGQTRTDSEPRTKTEHKRDRRPRLSVATFYRIEEYWTNKQGHDHHGAPLFSIYSSYKKVFTILFLLFCFAILFRIINVPKIIHETSVWIHAYSCSATGEQPTPTIGISLYCLRRYTNLRE